MRLRGAALVAVSAPAMLNYLSIAAGSAIGGVLRVWLCNVLLHRPNDPFPLGTLVVNVTGSFAIGFFFTLTQPDGRFAVNPVFRDFFMAGVCGGYTTFSAFSLQTLTLARQGAMAQAGANVLLSVALCLVAVWLGHLLAKCCVRAA